MNYQAEEDNQNNYNYNYNQDSGDNYNYYSQSQNQQQQQQPFITATTGPTPTTGYPTFATSASSPPQAHPFSANSNAFDNVDISRSGNGNRFSSGTPFETVHEFVSVNNKVKLCVHKVDKC